MALDRKQEIHTGFIPPGRFKPGVTLRDPDAGGGAPSQTGDRRAACRYPAAGMARAALAPAGDPLAEAPALLIDLSQSGAMVAVERVPRGGALWIRLVPESGPPGGWFTARVVGMRPDPVGDGSLLRLEFPDGCPYEVFKAGIWGT